MTRTKSDWEIKLEEKEKEKLEMRKLNLGKSLATQLNETGNTTKDRFDFVSEELGLMLYELWNSETTGEYSEKKGDCSGMGEYLLERAKSTFYGQVINGYIPKYLELYELLEAGGHIGQKNAFEYGDIDFFVWIEKTDNPDTKIIASKDNKTCRDQNFQLFIYNKNSITEKFLARFVWDRQKKSRYANWGDHRDYDRWSMATYRKANFELGYGDARDEGHAFSWENKDYGNYLPETDKPQWHENDLVAILRYIDWHLCALKSERR